MIVLWCKLLYSANFPVKMSSRIDQLPIEISTYIFSCLRHADLANLMRVSKFFQRLVTPLLWTHIELHRPGWHEYFQYKDASDTAGINRNDGLRNYIEPPSDKSDRSTLRDYLATDDSGYYISRCERYIRFLQQFDGFVWPAHLDGYTSYKHVKSLCMDVDVNRPYRFSDTPSVEFWAIFSAFQNLESLELIVDWPHEPKEWDIREQRFSDQEMSLPFLTKLRNLRLRGYIPQNFARWVLTCPEKLKTLELSILDRPIGSNNFHKRKNPPPVRERDRYPLEDIEDDGGDIPWVTEVSDSDSDSEEDLDAEAVGPRALAVCQDTDIPDKLATLSTLILTRPAQSSSEEGVEFGEEICCSIRSDRAILREWACLIRATRHTLQHLVLDQRPFCEEIEMDGTGNNEFLELYPYGPGFQRFKDTVLPVLLEDIEWPMLKSIRFYGFDTPEPRQTEPSHFSRWPSQQYIAQHTFWPRIKQRFEHLGVDIKSSLGLRMIFQNEDGTVYYGDGLGGHFDQD